jgi:hypothetical protein
MVGFGLIWRADDDRCDDDEPACVAGGRNRMNTDAFATQTIEEFMRIRTGLIVRAPVVLRQWTGRAAAWFAPDTSYPKHGFVQCAARFRAASFSRQRASVDRPDCAMRAARTSVNALRRPVGSAVHRPFRSQVGRTLPHASAGHSRLSAGARFSFPTCRRAFACVRPSWRRPARLPEAATPLSLSPPLRGFSTPQ